MVGEEGDGIRARSDDARQAIEHSSDHVYASQKAVETRARVVEQIRQRLAEDEVRRSLHKAEQEADHVYQLTAKQVENEVGSAELEYKSAHDASQRARDVLSGFLQSLENAIQNSTASRNRVIPSA